MGKIMLVLRIESQSSDQFTFRLEDYFEYLLEILLKKWIHVANCGKFCEFKRRVVANEWFPSKAMEFQNECLHDWIEVEMK